MQNVNLETFIIKNPETVYSRLDDGQTMVLELGRKRYYYLNESALFLYRCLEETKGMSVGALVDAMMAEYEVTLEEARSDVCGVIEEMLQRELVHVGKPSHRET
jgi:hypothetical protein